MWKERYQFVEEVRDNAHEMDKKIPERNGISYKNLKHFSYSHTQKEGETWVDRVMKNSFGIKVREQCEGKRHCLLSSGIICEPRTSN